MANLRLKGGRFHFRRKIPYNLRAEFGRSEIVRSLQTGERRTAAVRARVVWLKVESVFEQVLAQPTLDQEEIDGLVRKAASNIAWADEVRMARSGSLFSHHGDGPWDADAILLESDAFDYRESLARNDVTSVRAMARRYLDEAGFAVPPGGLDEMLVGRALLRLLAQTSEETAGLRIQVSMISGRGVGRGSRGTIRRVFGVF